MFKACFATLAALTCTFGGLDGLQAEASEGWSTYVAARACVHLRNGVNPREAGRLAGLDGLKTSYRSEILAASQRSTSYLGQVLGRQMMQICPETVTTASQRFYR